MKLRQKYSLYGNLINNRFLDFIKSIPCNVVLILVFLILISLNSCKAPEKAEPPILDAKQMIDALTAIYIGEAKAHYTYDLNVQKDEYFRLHLYPTIFDSLGIAGEDFYQSYAFFEDQTEDFVILMDQVIAKIDSMQADSISQETGERLEDVYHDIHEREIINDKFDISKWRDR